MSGGLMCCGLKSGGLKSGGLMSGGIKSYDRGCAVKSQSLKWIITSGLHFV